MRLRKEQWITEEGSNWSKCRHCGMSTGGTLRDHEPCPDDNFRTHFWKKVSHISSFFEKKIRNITSKTYSNGSRAKYTQDMNTQEFYGLVNRTTHRKTSHKDRIKNQDRKATSKPSMMERFAPSFMLSLDQKIEKIFREWEKENPFITEFYATPYFMTMIKRSYYLRQDYKPKKDCTKAWWISATETAAIELMEYIATPEGQAAYKKLTGFGFGISFQSFDFVFNNIDFSKFDFSEITRLRDETEQINITFNNCDLSDAIISVGDMWFSPCYVINDCNIKTTVFMYSDTNYRGETTYKNILSLDSSSYNEVNVNQKIKAVIIDNEYGNGQAIKLSIEKLKDYNALNYKKAIKEAHKRMVNF